MRFFCAAAVSLAVAGCGGGDSGGGDEVTTADHPEPSEPLADQLPRFEQALDSLDCDDAIEVVHPVQFEDPANPSSPANCRQAVDVIRPEQGAEIIDSEELGTGGIVDTKFRGNDETTIWALDASARFKYTANYIVRDPQVGTEADPDTNFQGVADAYVKAMRDGDCHAAHPLLAGASRLGYGSEKTFCKLFDDNYTKTPQGLSSRLQADPEATPILLDATEAVAMFGLSTEPAGYRTLVLVTTGPGGDVLVDDVLPTER